MVPAELEGLRTEGFEHLFDIGAGKIVGDGGAKVIDDYVVSLSERKVGDRSEIGRVGEKGALFAAPSGQRPVEDLEKDI